MDALTLLETRSSTGALVAPAPSRAELERIITLAMRAPDHGRLRPWRFLVIEGEGRKALGEALVQALLARQPDAPAPLLDKEREKPLRAPMILVAAAMLTDHPKVPQVEQLLAVGAATQNVMLALPALGYGGIWRTGEPSYDPVVKRALGLAHHDAIVGFLYIGTPDPAADHSDRLPRPQAADFLSDWPAA